MGLKESGILLVEDDSNDILFIQRAMKRSKLNNPMQVVRDGDEAVAYLAGKEKYADRNVYPLPTIILLDLKLPRRSGLEVLAWLRQQHVIKRIPVVILTSSREHVDVNRAYDIGVNSYLLKPVNHNALNDMIEMLNAYWVNLNCYPSIVSI
ncbi:response regulator with CheY-like receiver domain and winged-helix DNA-binding domain [Rivularia sp. PCC 7116]|uniref:response regulator n=1 Tax=Rivularia sp. PCC 7116 TaxID=373994 RepID=UPI00029F3B66|nr:response regulator [Rivularia sp. PCC 7116]AFY55842.1 response regulator with CheY-like receiver domain and winged-helix DNA-binding domain [Rivularia sp. PCC 7116]